MSNFKDTMRDMLKILNCLNHQYIDDATLSKNTECELGDFEEFKSFEQAVADLIGTLGSIKKTKHSDRTYAFSRVHSLLLGYHSKISDIDDLIKQFIDKLSEELKGEK